jgi:hypothetical protein
MMGDGAAELVVGLDRDVSGDSLSTGKRGESKVQQTGNT